MKKILSLIVLVILTLSSIGTTTKATVPSTNNCNTCGRLIVPTTSILDKISYRLKGCEIVHELNDATALRCPTGVKIEGAFEDQVYHITDMDANLQIGADHVWNLGYTGEGVTVAILDTGIDTDHPELVNSIVDCVPMGLYESCEDDNGHGTHVAGIITADGVNEDAKGVAPDTKIWMGKVCNLEGVCCGSDIAEGIEYVVKNKIAEIISLSIGGGGTRRPNCDNNFLAQKVNWAVENDLTVVVSAGNDPTVVSAPGCASGAIAVGAVDKSDLLASFSGRGKALDIVAPGVSIFSSIIDGYYSWSGTSMATPHVSATVALIKQNNPEWTDKEIKEALYNSAVNLGLSSREQGYGRVDAYGAVTYSGTPEEPSTCTPRGVKCNCDGSCNFKETVNSCPWDCE